MMKVLLVEDDPMVAFINKQYLENIGDIKVIGPVIEEKEIIEQIEKEDIDLILLDVFLPKKNGIDILGNLRRKKYLVDVIIISAANAREEIKQAFAYGAIDYLIKPFNFERFEEAINKYKLRNELLHKSIDIKQKDIDYIYSTNNKFCNLPKGLNKGTLDNLLNFLSNSSNKIWTIREIAKEINLSNVTVKKYMDYLEEIDKVSVEITYGNIGRPELKYDLKNK